VRCVRTVAQRKRARVRVCICMGEYVCVGDVCVCVLRTASYSVTECWFVHLLLRNPSECFSVIWSAYRSIRFDKVNDMPQ